METTVAENSYTVKAIKLRATVVDLLEKVYGLSCYLGRLCSRRKEISFLLYWVFVLLGVSHKKRILRRQMNVILRSGLLDSPWYRKHYREHDGAFLSPALHYLRTGAKLGFDPSALFHSKWYLRKYTRHIPKGMNPLIHYIEKGRIQGFRQTASLESQAFLDGFLPSSKFESSEEFKRWRVVYVSADPDLPGHIYRVERYARALFACGYDVHVISIHDVNTAIQLLESASAIIMWRTVLDKRVKLIYDIASRTGAKVIYDIDDLIIDPSIANPKFIDAIRFANCDEQKVAIHYEGTRNAAALADYCTAATEPLLSALRRLAKPGFLLPNGFDNQTYLCTRRAVAQWRSKPSDGLIRIGYAGGTRTHQKDFAQAVSAIARVLREHSECRLVLFRVEDPISLETQVCLDPLEYPELAELEAQIEWLPFRPLRELPEAIARFDINLAPLEYGNPFCESKSELKYFEAALAEIPTVASPTVPFANAIKHGKTGFLARSPQEWYTILKFLVANPDKRRQIGKAALNAVYWHYGPEHRAELIGLMMDQVLFGRHRASKAFQLELLRQNMEIMDSPELPEYEVLFESGTRAISQVAVIVSLYNYGLYITEALDSVKAQTLSQKDLIIVDDTSTDNSLSIARLWLEQNASAFTHVALLRNQENSGLARTRNAGIAFTDAPLVMILDADNILMPNCLERCLMEITRTGAAVAYPIIHRFGSCNGYLSNEDWSPARLMNANYVDAMAMICRSAWARAGGFQTISRNGGWQDYDLWCRFIELGLYGYCIKEVLAYYRVHQNSMLHTSTDQPKIKEELVQQMRIRHPWLILPEFQRAC